MKDNKALKVTCIVVIALLLVATLALTMLKNYLMLPDGKVRDLIAAERLVCHPETFLDDAVASPYQLDSAGQRQFLEQFGAARDSVYSTRSQEYKTYTQIANQLLVRPAAAVDTRDVAAGVLDVKIRSKWQTRDGIKAQVEVVSYLNDVKLIDGRYHASFLVSENLYEYTFEKKDGQYYILECKNARGGLVSTLDESLGRDFASYDEAVQYAKNNIPQNLYKLFLVPLTVS